MARCPECGIEYNDNALQCSFCGNKLKETPKTVEDEKISSSKTKFNASAIFLGTLTFSVSMIFTAMLIILLSLYYPLNSSILLLIIVIPLLTGNILACWVGNSTYWQSILNGGIIGILPVGAMLIFGLANFAVLVIFFIMGVLGGILGKFITSKIIKNPRKDSNGKIRLALLFLFVMVIVIFSTSPLIAGSNNMTYDKNGISFNYIGELVASDNPENTHPFGTGNNLTVVATLNGVNKTAAHSDNLIISQGPATLSLTDAVNAEKASIQKYNCTIISETNLTVDGVPATEIAYNNTEGITGMDLLFIKNNNLYSINFNYNGDLTNLKIYTVFLMIENSLHVE